MKVVLFCGGLGTRIREYSEKVPKPMVPIGELPILWHVMKYYSHFGHTDFILALGYKAEVIKNFFSSDGATGSDVLELSMGARSAELMSSDMNEWNITFVDTGIDSNLGERLCAVRDYLDGDEIFMANYADGLTDMNLDAYVEEFEQGQAVAKFLAVTPPLSYHIVEVGTDHKVMRIEAMAESTIKINGGFFILRQEVFEHMNDGEELVVEPFNRLLKQGKLEAVDCDGFWTSMDTFKDKQRLDDLCSLGAAPWMVWKNDAY